jgi:hypothetical protein
VVFLGGAIAMGSYIFSQFIAQKVFQVHYLGIFFTLRTWISLGVTVFFYSMTGYFLEQIMIPLGIDQFQFMQGIFIGSGLLIMLLVPRGLKIYSF